MDQQKQMSYLGSVCGCIEFCLNVMTQTSRSRDDEMEMRSKLMKAKDIVLKLAQAIEYDVIERNEP